MAMARETAMRLRAQSRSHAMRMRDLAQLACKQWAGVSGQLPVHCHQCRCCAVPMRVSGWGQHLQEGAAGSAARCEA